MGGFFEPETAFVFKNITQVRRHTVEGGKSSKCWVIQTVNKFPIYNERFFCHVQEGDRTLEQIIQITTLHPIILKFCFNFIFTQVHFYQVVSSLQKLWLKCHIIWQPHSYCYVHPQFYHPTNIWWRVQNVKLIIM